MQTATSWLAIAFAAVLALWPVAFLVVVVLHALARRWRRVGQVALLLPLWTIASSVGLVQLPTFIAALGDPSRTRSPLVTVLSIALALCCAAVAWALLIRSFDRPTRPLAGHNVP